jgi:hypothetical protein
MHCKSAFYLHAILLVTFIISSCNQIEKKQEQQINKSTSKNEIVDSFKIVNDCSNDIFSAVLEENLILDSNAFKLTIKSKPGQIKKVQILNVRPRFSKINYCTKDYVVVGFSCGGPCYSQVFVPVNENKPIQQFDFARQVYGIPNIITHFINEEFDSLVVQNLDNGKNLKIDISDISDKTFIPSMDTQYIVNEKFVVKYDSDSKHPKKKVIDLQEILQ